MRAAGWAVVERQSAVDVAAAYERWAYGEGWTAGLAEGERRGFDDGYRVGFDTGAEVGAGRLLLGLETALGGRLPELLPQLPHVQEYLSYRTRTRSTNMPCSFRCGSCSRCIRSAAASANSSRYGQPDYPGLSHEDSAGGGRHE